MRTFGCWLIRQPLAVKNLNSFMHVGRDHRSSRMSAPSARNVFTKLTPLAFRGVHIHYEFRSAHETRREIRLARELQLGGHTLCGGASDFSRVQVLVAAIA